MLHHEPINLDLACTILSDTIVGFNCTVNCEPSREIEIRISCPQAGNEDFCKKCVGGEVVHRLWRGLDKGTKYTITAMAIGDETVHWSGKMVVTTRDGVMQPQKLLLKRLSFSTSGIYTPQTLQQSLLRTPETNIPSLLPKAAKIVSQNKSFASLSPTLLYPLQGSFCYKPFEVDVDFAMAIQSRSDIQLPLILFLLCDRLGSYISKGQGVRKLFRTSGNKCLVSALHQLTVTITTETVEQVMLKYKNDVEILLEVFSASDCADALKSYLGALPIPLLADTGTICVNDLAYELPHSHRYCLHSVCSLLRNTSLQPSCDINVETLSSMFAAIFFRNDNIDMSENLVRFKGIMESRTAVVAQLIRDPSLLQIPTAPLPDGCILVYC
eukprot:TRINITY_DN3406_c0_g1_i1.p1 TRINITY_DN3406_c0_g1~~TRINITY_DN3406_c0_g1_i1.p1  ORF type:complete len:384 (+),score=39.05 TRINITY_DN3406_c0_g1_i1:113-1264(+)